MNHSASYLKKFIEYYLPVNSNKKYGLRTKHNFMWLILLWLGFSNLVFSADEHLLAETVNQLQSRAKTGESEAQYMLGKLYYYGFGVKRNYKEATKWFRAAAIQGHASSQFLLGEACEKGKGMRRDLKQAVKWYERAAFQKNDLAIHNLSFLYAHGLGVRKNLIKAYALNKLIAAQGWEMVKSLKAELETNMDQEQKERAQILSIELKKKIRTPLP